MRSNDGVAGRFRGRAHRATIGLLVLGVFAACAAGATATAQLSQAGGLPYKVVGKIGKEGKANGQFSGNAYGLATDKAGNVYVADSGNLRIQQFSANGAYSAKYTFAPGENVIDVAVGPTGDVWGTTDVLTQVRRFPNGGGASENLTTPKSSGGIAVDADGNVYVATKGDNVNAVVRFDKAASGWAPAKTWVGGGLQSPGDVEVSSDGTIYVADTRGAPPNVKRYERRAAASREVYAHGQAARHGDVRRPALDGHGSRPDRRPLRLRHQHAECHPLRGGPLEAASGACQRCRRREEGRRLRRACQVHALERGLPGPGRRHGEPRRQGYCRKRPRQGRCRQDDRDRDPPCEGRSREGRRQDHTGHVQDRPEDERPPNHADARRHGARAASVK
jgi:hypothetical protein